MVSIISLWLPILLSAVFVFIISAIIHMLLPYHRNDYGKIPFEDEVMEALGKLGIPPGDYMMPFGGSSETMRDPKFIAKMEKGPVAFMTISKPGKPQMWGGLMMWFIYNLIVSIFAAYIAGRAVGPGAPFNAVFRFAGVVAFAGYSLALFYNSIWYKIKWSTTFKLMFDGLIYAIITGATFGWLWPKIVLT